MLSLINESGYSPIAFFLKNLSMFFTVFCKRIFNAFVNNRL